MASATLAVKGVLEPDGSLHLAEVPSIPPGPVEVVLTSIAERPSTAEADAEREKECAPRAIPRREVARRPDFIWPDECISAPFDLPRLGPRRRVEVRQGGVRLPDPAFLESLLGDDDL